MSRKIPPLYQSYVELALSLRAIANDIPGAKVAAERLATAIVARMLHEDLRIVRRTPEEFDEPEFEWRVRHAPYAEWI